MMLLLDIGNSSLKWGLGDAGGISVRGRVDHREAGWQQVLAGEWKSLTAPQRVIAASVAGAGIADSIDHLVQQYWGLQPHYLQTAAEACGVCNAYPEPSRLGIDRWAALVAAWHRYRADVSVVDCGTAITVDRVTANGRHMGGLILPGVVLLQHALLDGTARLPHSMPFEFATPFATDSGTAIVSGALYTAAAALDRALQSMDRESGHPAQIVLTGGDAARIAPLLGQSADVCQDLVLEGVALLAGGN